MTLSIVIPTKNEENQISNLLDCLSRQTYQDFDIIVADASSTDKTLEKIHSHALSSRIRIVTGGLPGVGRNKGAEISESEFLLFIDADATMKDDHLIKKSMKKMIKKELNLVTTYLSCRNNSVVMFIYLMNNAFQFMSKLDKPYSTGIYFLIRKKKFDELGGFNEEDQYAEDYNLSRKVHKKKFDIIPSFIYTDDRRFRKMGYSGVIQLFLKTLLNKNNEKYYKEKIDYFK